MWSPETINLTNKNFIKEAVHIRKEGPRSMNRDEGSYQLSRTYDRFLG